MISRLTKRRWLPIAVALGIACGGSDSTAPSDGPAARLDAGSDVVRIGLVGTTLADPLLVKVKDAKGHPVKGATVTFAITQGNGSISPRVATTDQTGSASATWVLGNTVGINEVTAAVAPLATPIKFTATASAGPVAKITITPQNIRILNGVDNLQLTATSLDAYGNVTAPTPTLVPRDPTLVSVDARGLLRVVRRGGSTYVIASANGRTDSVLVTVLAPGESICTGVVSPTVMTVGQVITDVTSGSFCVRSSGAGEEYALIPYFNSSVPSALTQVEVRGSNVVLAPPASVVASRSGTSARPTLVPDDAFEDALRRREREIMTPASLAAARREGAALRSGTGARASISVAVPAVGDLVSYNVNSLENCAHPDFRTGRVAAITNRAIVVADTANPAGGFTDEQYRSIGVTFDTLVDPVDVAAFGEPADIDGNGRSILFFTRAINQLTPRGSTSLVLGLFYGRDLTSKTACAGSNAAEMFYLLVPDPDGTVSDSRSASSVVTWTNGTVAHEYQHLINASRRSGGNPNVSALQEETWLNEGLSHIAEELVFFRASGLPMRANLAADAITATPRAGAAFSTYEANNFARFRRYLLSTESQAPISSDVTDADLQTRGAIWSFLRYAADRQPGGDGTLWYRLANSTTIGMANLTEALGTDPAPLLRDWAVSLFMDDNAPNVDRRFLQPSWNLRNALSLVSTTGTTYPLNTRAVLDNASMVVTLNASGVSFLRFGVPAAQDALLTMTSTGLPLPPSIQLSVVRVK